jgi:hypothetical protein
MIRKSVKRFSEGIMPGQSGAGVECRQQMAWQTPRRNQDGVKSELKFGMLGVRHQPPLRGVTA